jgi:hypothetical protein
MKLDEYYQIYLGLHQNTINRRLHVIGQFITIFFIIWSILSQNYLMLLFAPFIIYPFAWTGHLFFEKNKPAAFNDPIKAKISDFIMLKDILTGKIKW